MAIPWSEADFGRAEKAAAFRVIRSGWLTQGKETELFEKELARYLGVDYAVVTNSGTSALIASLLSHGIGPGDEVIVPTYTFIATVNSVLAIGAKPILADSHRDYFDITPDTCERLITKRTRAIMPVDVMGMPIDVVGFRKLCRKYKLALIEDGAQAIGAEYKGRKIGSWGHSTIFSFHMAKVVTAVEGGCVVTNNKSVADGVRMIRNHGRLEFYQPRKHGTEYNFEGFGLNFRINDVLSAIGRVQLAKVNRALAHRKRLVAFYKKELANLFEFQKIPEYVTVHANMIFAILCPKGRRDYINQKLFDAGVQTRITWPCAHKQKWHRLYFGKVSLPSAEEISERILSIPIGNKISLDQASRVVKVLRQSLL